MLKHRRFWIRGGLLGLVLAGLAGLAGLVAINLINLSALTEPGGVETYIANQGKHFFVSRAAERTVPAAPKATSSGTSIGEGLFIGACSACHGADGRTPSDIGQRMFPRAADLGSAHVQTYSDKELFWIVKNGIRLTGMPGLGNTQPDENIWRIVQFLRTLKNKPPDV